jgi:hypothetical protein
MGHGMGGGGFAAHGGPGFAAHGGPGFGGRETVGVAPNVHANRVGPGFQNGPHNFRGRTFNRNDRFARNDRFFNRNDRFGHFRDHRHFNRFFAFGGFGPYYDDSYGYDDYAYNDCSYYNRWDWRWRRYCGPYAYGNGPYGYDSAYGW